MRKSARFLLAAAAIAIAGCPVLAQPTTGDVWYSWTPKPDKLPPYGQNQPVTRLPAILARHKGQARWSQQVILTKRYDAKWIQAAPGDKSVTQYYADDRVVWVVWGGQIRSPSRANSLSWRPEASWRRCRSRCATVWKPSAANRRYALK